MSTFIHLKIYTRDEKLTKKVEACLNFILYPSHHILPLHELPLWSLQNITFPSHFTNFIFQGHTLLRSLRWVTNEHGKNDQPCLNSPCQKDNIVVRGIDSNPWHKSCGREKSFPSLIMTVIWHTLYHRTINLINQRCYKSWYCLFPLRRACCFSISHFLSNT